MSLIEMKAPFVQADATRLPFPDGTFDLTFTSPPYCDARKYNHLVSGGSPACKHKAGPPRADRHWQYRNCVKCDGFLEYLDAQRGTLPWVAWQADVVAECCRVTDGLVIVNCAGVTRDYCYQPAPEGLLYSCWQAGIRCWRPCYWFRVGIPGSGGAEWYRADIEYLLAFTTTGATPAPTRKVISRDEVTTKSGSRLRHTLECGHSYNRRDIWHEIPCGYCVHILKFADPTANGHPPKWAPGGEMSNRLSSGARANQWGHSLNSGATTTDGDFVRSKGRRPSHKNALGVATDRSVGTRANGLKDDSESYRDCDKTHTKRRADGTMVTQGYNVPTLANPGNLLRIIVGGGVMGHPLSHDNEAPFPEKLPEFFIKSHCPPGGKVLDPFSGSGTTVDVARKLGRIGIGCDLRMSQCELGVRRLATPYAKKIRKAAVAKDAPNLFTMTGVA